MRPPVRIGILGAARVAAYAMIAPARADPRAQIVAVAARDPDRARAYAETHGIPATARDYDELLAMPDIDVIYNALPPSRHADLTIAALGRGKHVLCEKPFAMNAREARAMVDAADAGGRLLMEAFHYRYHPLFEALLQRLHDGAIGPLEFIDARFMVRVPETPGELRFEAGLGGGALMDLGTYCLHWCRTVAAAPASVTRARCTRARSGVDLHTEATIRFANGIDARIECGFDADFHASLTLNGRDGVIAVHNPLVPQFGHSLEIRSGAGTERLAFERTTTYQCQLRALVDALETGRPPPTSGRDSIEQMALVEGVRQSL